MFYAIRYAYGSTVANGGQRADEVYKFTARRLRDAWVADGPPVDGEGFRAVATARTGLVRRADYHIDGDAEAWRAIATRRVEATPALRPYRDLLIDEDWGQNDHYHWTATASEHEIVSWAKATRAQVEA